ncbi:MAG TPA: TonB family protein [Blastocatellia bacterium]
MSTSTSGALRLAEEYAVRGKFEEAIGIYRRVVEMDPSNIAAKARLNELYGLTKQAQGSNGTPSPDALTRGPAVTRRMEATPKAEELHDPATAAASEVVTVDEEHLVANISRAEISFGFGSFDEAISILTNLLDRYPDEPRVYAKLKDIYLRSGMPDRAAAVYLDLARIYEAKGDVKMASQCLASAERLSSAVPEYSDLRGTGNLLARHAANKVVSTPKQPQPALGATQHSKDQPAAPVTNRVVASTPGAQVARQKPVPAPSLGATSVHVPDSNPVVTPAAHRPSEMPPNVTDELASLFENQVTPAVRRAFDGPGHQSSTQVISSEAARGTSTSSPAPVTTKPDPVQPQADVNMRQTGPDGDLTDINRKISPAPQVECDDTSHATAPSVEEIKTPLPPIRLEPQAEPSPVVHDNGVSVSAKAPKTTAAAAGARSAKKVSKGSLMGISMDTGPIKETPEKTSPKKSSATRFLAAAIVVAALGGSVGGYYLFRGHQAKAATVAETGNEAASAQPQTSPDVVANGQAVPEVVTSTSDSEAKVTDLSQETALTPQQQKEQQLKEQQQREQQQRAQDQKAEEQKDQQLEQQRREADLSRQAQEQAALAAQSQPVSSPSNSPARARSVTAAPPLMNSIGAMPSGNAGGPNLAAGGIPRSLATPPPPVAKAPSPIIRSTGPVYGAIVRRVQPSYPQIARATHATGTVTVEVNVDEQGEVVSAHVVSGPGVFTSAAESAARGFKFKPSTMDGKVIRTSRTIVFNFKEQ